MEHAAAYFFFFEFK